MRQGKGRKDRMIPIGQRALDWIDRYTTTVRLQWAPSPDLGVLFLTVDGTPVSLHRLTTLMKGYVTASGVAKEGWCHLFRHTTATLMLEGGADIRFVQQMLGHVNIATTHIYAQVTIFVSMERYSTFVVFSSQLAGLDFGAERCSVDWFYGQFFAGERASLVGAVADLSSVDDFLFGVKWLKLRLGDVSGVVPLMGNRPAVGFTLGSLHDVADDVYGDEPDISDFDFELIDSVAREALGELEARRLLLADAVLAESIRDGVFLWPHMFDGNDVAEVVWRRSLQ